MTTSSSRRALLILVLSQKEKSRPAVGKEEGRSACDLTSSVCVNGGDVKPLEMSPHNASVLGK